MRMSCNGCRVLRKGCSDACAIRPCLEWIKTAESQANATVFLAKFYGRAGLMNLINAAPQNLRPAVFRSLLYEACGRMVNPTYGSVGLLWSGNWQICQAAVECILKGCPIRPISGPVRGGRDSNPRPALLETIARELHKVGSRSRSRFKSAKRTAGGASPGNRGELADEGAAPPTQQVCNLRGRRCYPGEFAEFEPPTNVVSSASCCESERDTRELAEAGFPTWKATGAADVAECEGVSSDDVEVELELRLGSPGCSDHEKMMSAQGHWSPVASCLDLALTPPS